MTDHFTAPDVLNMFDHLYDDFKSKTIEGRIFEIKWTKDICKIRDHMYAQVGPISITYQKSKKLSSEHEPVTQQTKKSPIEIPNKIKPEECFVHRGFNKQYKKRYQSFYKIIYQEINLFSHS